MAYTSLVPVLFSGVFALQPPFQVQRTWCTNRRDTDLFFNIQVIQGVKPDEQLVKVVHDEMKELLGSRRTDLVKPKIGPRVVLLAGLQGVGKTTACGKMAKYLTENEEDVLVVSTDVYRCSSELCFVHVADSCIQRQQLSPLHFSAFASCVCYRPAAIDQLETLCKNIDVDFLRVPVDDGPAAMAAAAVKEAKKRGKQAVLIDTAGRLQADEEMMQELKDIKAKTKPSDTLLVVDAMTGQEAAQVRTFTHLCLCST